MKKLLHLKLHTLFLIAFIVLMTLLLSLCFWYLSNVLIEITIMILLALTYTIFLIYLYLQNKDTKHEISQIQDAFDFYSTKLMNESGIGIIIFNNQKKII
jgi:c-di-AMP phosphodiesterase-like protein